MRLGRSLSVKILAWFVLNLVLLALLASIFAWRHFQPGLNWLIAGAAAERVQTLSSLVVGELDPLPASRWDDPLNKIAKAYGVGVAVFNNTGRQIAGSPVKLPREALDRLSPGMRGRGEGPPDGGREPPEFGPGGFPPRPDGSPGPGRMAAGGAPNDYPKFVVRAAEPARYWIGVRAPLTDRGTRPPGPATLFFIADSLGSGGLLLDPRPWLLMVSICIGASVILWLPLVRGITRALRRMMGAAESIAQGNFDTRLDLRRSDELGRVSTALNHMAARLQEFFTGQKRFLGDIAHELCSPLARMEMALGILEQRASDDKQRAYVEDVREEVRAMSALVNELLAFSKAAVGGGAVTLKPVPLADLAQRVVGREAPGSPGVTLDIAATLQVMAEPELLARALGNVVRNAVRHGGGGPIAVRAEAKDGGMLVLSVADSGPGVPEEALPRLFDAFYRPDAARARETGGAGLGLAIVKTCVEACGGTVTARNRERGGLEVIFTLVRGA